MKKIVISLVLLITFVHNTLAGIEINSNSDKFIIGAGIAADDYQGFFNDKVEQGYRLEYISSAEVDNNVVEYKI